MKCPYCTVEIHPAFTDATVKTFFDAPLAAGYFHTATAKVRQTWGLSAMTCPACEGALIRLHQTNGAGAIRLVEPKSGARTAAKEVPDVIGEDFNEAALVLQDSPKSSAALSRRCVQAVLAGQGYKHHELARAIQAAIDAKQLPSSLAENLDAIRASGNFAAHPLKDTNTGAILPVEPHEAEWNLEVLEGLFDFYYVQPAKDKLRREAMNAKLAAAGKGPMKGG